MIRRNFVKTSGAVLTALSASRVEGANGTPDASARLTRNLRKPWDLIKL